MKKINSIICLICVALVAVSCSKHEIEYDTDDIQSGVAEFQLHYVVPVVSSTATYIYQVNINDSLYANSNSVLVPYNAIPSGDIGRFYTAKVGTTNIKLYTGKTTQTLNYDQSCTLKEGKQNVFVYDLAKAPIVFDNGYPYTANTTADTDSTAWIKFYNFLYEDATTPTTMKLQYQYYYTDPNTKVTTDPVNIGSPVAFGETTGWQPIKVIKNSFNSSGYLRIYYKIKVIDANGNDTGDLSITNAKGKVVTYSDYWNAYIGRRYHHTFAGVRTAKAPSAAVYVFTAL